MHLYVALYVQIRIWGDHGPHGEDHGPHGGNHGG